MSSLLCPPLQIFFGKTHTLLLKQPQHIQIAKQHAAIEGIADFPYRVGFQHAAEIKHTDKQQSICPFDRSSLKQIIQAPARIIVPAQHRGKSKQKDHPGKQETARRSEKGRKTFLHQHGPVTGEKNTVREKAKQYQRTDRRYDKCIKKHLDDSDKSQQNGFITLFGGICQR